MNKGVFFIRNDKTSTQVVISTNSSCTIMASNNSSSVKMGLSKLPSYLAGQESGGFLTVCALRISSKGVTM